MKQSNRELKEENATLTTKLSEAGRARTAAEAAASAAASEAAAARDEARLAARRAQALQEAIAGDLSSNNERDSDRYVTTLVGNIPLGFKLHRPPLHALSSLRFSRKL